MNKGWIKVHRKLMDSDRYFDEPFCRNMAWIDLLLLANHKDKHFRIRGIKVEVRTGQVGYSSIQLASRWRWSRGKVIRYLKELQDDNMIVQQKNNLTTLISIVNYSTYQFDDTADDTADDTTSDTASGTAKRQQTVQQTDINKNVKNIKEEYLNKYAEDVPPPPPPDLELGFFPTTDMFNGLPEKHSQDLIKLVKIVKKIDIDVEETRNLWDVFKSQILDGTKFYSNDEAVYRHFVNWGKGHAFKKGAKPRKSKESGESITGIEYLNDFMQCKMSDGSVQDLNENQRDSAKFQGLKPSLIVKK